MLSVIGGYYREICLEPRWDHLYGSGMRAACAVSKIVQAGTSKQVELHTWATASQRRDAEMQAQTFGVAANVHERQDQIEFQYDYGLAQPRLYPSPKDIIRVDKVEIRVENAVLFSLLEDSPAGSSQHVKVTADTLVYDPQAEESSIPWTDCGHSCRRLAIVANFAEAAAMAKSLKLSTTPNIAHPQVLAQTLLANQQAEVVIVKNGAEGAFVATKGDIHHIPSYKTRFVFPFGSGDIFTSVFGAYWAELGIDPVLSAQRASIAAAVHSNSRTLPIPLNLDSLQGSMSPLKISRAKDDRRRPFVYLAGPLFTFPQRWFLTQIRHRLGQQGVNVFSPLHDVGVGKSDVAIASEDLEGLEKSAVVFAILDGLDSGTLFEIGYAVAKKIPVVGFRQVATDGDLTMLKGSGCQIESDLPTAIYHAAWKALEQ